MNKILIVMFILLSCLFMVNAQDQLILNYKYETGTGSIAFDSSSNGFHGIINNPVWVSDSAFGDYALSFPTGNNYIEVVLPLQFTTEFCLAGWIKPTIDYGTNTLVDIENGVINKFKYYYNNNNVYLQYRDDSGVLRTQTLGTGSLAFNTWQHLTLCINGQSEEFKYFINGLQINGGTFVGGYKLFGDFAEVRIGSSLTNAYQTGKILDDLFVINFEPTQDQLNELVQLNIITIEGSTGGENETPIELLGLVKVETLINSFSPFPNQEFTQENKINVNLNAPANCEFYVNSQLYKKGNEQISYTWEHDFTFGSYKGMFYCYYDYNSTRYYQVTPEFNFNVVMGDNSLITFFLTGLDYNVNDESLYIVTPCPKTIIELAGLGGKDAIKILNEGKSFYFQKIENGKATFDLTPITHEFCLINGVVQYDENNYTDTFNINQVLANVELGEFNIPSNVTQSYTLQTELLDVYEVYNPKAWGKSWAGIIGGFILLLFGGIIIIAGIGTNNGKVVIGGVILCIVAMGIEFNGVLGLLI